MRLYLGGMVTLNIASITSKLGRLISREMAYTNCRLRSVNLDLTYKCNLKCKMCGLWDKDLRGQGTELTTEELFDIIDKLHELNVGSITLAGAEPLIRKDIFHIINYISKRNIYSTLITNGTLLNIDMANSIISSGLNHVIVSIDGPRSIHNHIRGHENVFDMATKGIKALVAEKKQNKPILSVHCTVSTINVEHLTDLVQLCQDWGVDSISFQYITETPKDKVLNTKIDGKVIASDRFISHGSSLLLVESQIHILREQLKLIQTSGFKASTAWISNLQNDNLIQGTFPVRRCYHVRTNMTIDPYGNVSPCAHLNEYIIGNVRESSLLEIWRNDKYDLLRKLLSRQLFPICLNCCHHSNNFTSIQQIRMLLNR
jgi:radical SAM protein with 4Fe4S-binding SPASM domain